jgi:hypothetical protein
LAEAYTKSEDSGLATLLSVQCRGFSIYAYSTNYQIDLKAGIIVDVEATPPPAARSEAR